MQRKCAHVVILMSGPWYLARRYDPMVLARGIGSKLLNPGLDPLYWFSMVLSHGVNKGLPIKRKGDHLARHF